MGVRRVGAGRVQQQLAHDEIAAAAVQQQHQHQQASASQVTPPVWVL